MREIVCPGCGEEIRLALADEEPVAVTMERVGTEYQISANAQGVDLSIHACGASRRSRELREQRRAKFLDESHAVAARSEEAAGSGEPTQWTVHVRSNMQISATSGVIVASSAHDEDHHDYVVLLGDVRDAQ